MRVGFFRPQMGCQEHMMLAVGQIVPLYGDITTLNWVGARPAPAVATNLGYDGARLALGYWIAVLKEPLRPDDFEFGGTTLRSGGRLGLPERTAGADQERIRVHDVMMRRLGPKGYSDLQARTLRTVPMIGKERLVKVVPKIRHDDAMAPADQYPMGGGGLQWTIKKAAARKFLIAVEVDGSGTAKTPTFSVSLRSGDVQTLYDNRARISRYLETA